jgi:cytochrome b561
MVSQKISDRESGRAQAQRYDRLSIVLHWLTALLVVFMFASPYLWKLFERRTPPRLELQMWHFSLGLVMAVLIAGRIVWRVQWGRRLPAVSGGGLGAIAKIVHIAFYVLIPVQVILGITLRWSQHQILPFFGFFEIPDPVGLSLEMRHILGTLHYVNAWTIIALAIVHSLAALCHHYVLRDGTMARMS